MDPTGLLIVIDRLGRTIADLEARLTAQAAELEAAQNNTPEPATP